MINVRGKKILVVGLGVSGYAAAELLARKGAQVRITESSDNTEIRERLEELSRYPMESEIGAHTEEFCKSCDLVVASPGARPDSLPLSLAKSRKIPVIGELELGFRFCPAPIIAVTGTNGKSTTVELIGRILSVSGMHAVVCGNIGNPLSGVCEELTEKSVAVVEVSSFQLETIKDFKAHIAVLLNISEDHYERHGGYDSYKEEKFRIFCNQDENDWAVVHSDFRGNEMLEKTRSHVVYFGPESKEKILEVIKEEEIPLEGRHNLDNIASSILVARIMGSSDGSIREGIMTFKGLAHRFERVGVFNGIEFIDDSKATNIDATRWALESLEGKVILLAGGRDKGGDYSSISALVKNKVKAMVLIGEARDRITETFSSVVPVHAAETMAEAVNQARSIAKEGDTVMLSPMCSSFDMFSSYKERGEAFQQEVKKVTL
ncbi:MAG: UDP-N-acetylmuramoyl-L-alanine--D-glutamate ligase [Candidatus Omnitrophota bacterium]